MKAVILAGGLGARISEKTHLKPKPMIEIGAKPGSSSGIVPGVKERKCNRSA
jgi:dTDP-glucose pyrophosphorylase